MAEQITRLTDAELKALRGIVHPSLIAEVIERRGHDAAVADLIRQLSIAREFIYACGHVHGIECASTLANIDAALERAAGATA